jgi:beta-galactosidase
MSFKKDFIWGAATSAYQIEGGTEKGQKGTDIWDVFSETPGKVYGGHTGAIACDHYNRFEEDIELMRSLHLSAYRFSVSWARLMPDGTGEINQEGLAFYNKLIDKLVACGIEPYLTLYHWELPYELHKKGGWMNPEIVDWFARYAAVIAENFSDRVRHFFTFNEPQCIVGLGYIKGEHAPGLHCSPKDTLLMGHNLLKAHGKAVLALREHAKQQIKIGFVSTGMLNYPATEKPEDIEVAKKSVFSTWSVNEWALGISWWCDPVYLGHYPEKGLQLYRDVLPEITEEDMKLIHQPLDFIGQNVYHSLPICADETGSPVPVPYYDGYPKTSLNWPVTPDTLYWGPKFLYERYRLPILITENGMACHDVISLDGKVHDPNRIDFLNRYLKRLRDAADDGVDIGGYFHWSLMDNFEWAFGYGDRFGLVYIDYRNQQRLIKDSGFWYKDVIDQNGNNL